MSSSENQNSRKEKKKARPEPGYIKLSNAARFSPYSQEYLSLLARKGKIHAKKFGRNWYTTKKAINDYLKKQGIKIVLPKHLFNASYKGKINQPFDFLSISESSFQKKPKISFVTTGEKLPEKKLPEEKEEKETVIPEFQERGEEKIERVEKIEKPKTIKEPISTEEKILERLLTALESRLPPRRGFSGKFSEFDRRANKLFTSPTKSMLIAIIAVVVTLVLVGGFSFGNLDKAILAVHKFFKDAETLKGHWPGTHANEVLLLDKDGNISIYGHIETQGQLRSWVKEGIAPIVVDSTTTVENLSADYLDNLSSEDFTLAFVTKNGNITYEDVKLEGKVEVGKTLIVKGATKLLDSLFVYGNLGTFGDIVGKGSLKIGGSAEFGGKVKIAGPTEIKKALLALGGIKTEGANLDLGAGTIILTNRELIRNLNAEMLNGYHASDFDLDLILSHGSSSSRTMIVGGVSAQMAGFSNLSSGSFNLGNSEEYGELITQSWQINKDGEITATSATLSDTLEVGGQVTFHDNVTLSAPANLTLNAGNITASSISAPTNPSATATTGGTLDSGTYYYKITALNNNGETIGSSEVSATVDGTTTNAIEISWDEVTGAISYRIYRGTSSNGQDVYFEDSDGPPFLDTGEEGTEGTVPTENTTGGKGTFSGLSVLGTTISRSILPETDSFYNLGSPTLNWANVYAEALKVSNIVTSETLTIGGDLQVNGNTTLGDEATDITTIRGDTEISGILTFTGDNSEIRFSELGINGTNYVGFKAPDSLVGNNIYTLPTTYPSSSGLALVSDTNGVLSWAQAGVNDATYVTLTLHDALTAERVLTQGTNISITDGGANSTVTIATVADPYFATSVTSPLYTGTGAVTLSSGGSSDLTLDSASGTVALATGDSLLVPGTITVQTSGSSFTGTVTVGTLTDGTLSISGGNITGGQTAVFSTKVTTQEIENTGNITLDAINAAADSTVYVLNSNVTYEANLDVEGDITAGGAISGGDTTLSSLTVTGQTDLQGNVLDTTGNLTLADSVDISGGLTLAGDLSVDSGNITSTTTLLINPTGNLSFQSTSNYIDESGNLTIAGTITASGQNLTGPLTITTDTTPQLKISYNDSNYLTISVASDGAVTFDAVGTSPSFNIDDLLITSSLTVNGYSTFYSDVDFNLAETENFVITNTITETNSVDLVSLGLTNNTTSGSQRILVISNVGTGTTENGVLVTNTGTGVNAIEISGTWSTGILTNNNSINAGSGSITSGAITASGTLTVTSGGASITGNVTIEDNLSFIGASTIDSTGTLSINTTNNQPITTGTGSISGATTITASGNINTTGGALQTNSTTRIDNSGNLTNIGTISATGGITVSGTGVGITFSGTGDHLVQATSGTLKLGAATLTGIITGNSQDITGLNQLTADYGTFGPDTADVSTLIIKQTSYATPTKNIFAVQDSGGTTNYLAVDSQYQEQQLLLLQAISILQVVPYRQTLLPELIILEI